MRPIADTIEAMLDRGAFFSAWRRAQNRQVAINLARVGVDDHAADLLSEAECQAGLATCGRPGDDDEWRT